METGSSLPLSMGGRPGSTGTRAYGACARCEAGGDADSHRPTLTHSTHKK